MKLEGYNKMIKRVPGLPSAEVICEQAEMVSMGVRLIALSGNIRAEADQMHTAYSILDGLAPPRVYPFVIEHPDGIADCGYAASLWCRDLMEWIGTSQDIPDHLSHCLLGLLLGYSKERIQEHHESYGGKRFKGFSNPPSCPPRLAQEEAKSSGA